MKQKLKLSTFQIGTPPRRGQGLRLGVTRRTPRGVPKSHWAADGYFDVWLPTLAPSASLLRRLKSRDYDDPAVRKAFFDSYERELLATAASRQTIEFIVQVAMRTSVSIGCFCADESRCHRSRLLKILRRHNSDRVITLLIARANLDSGGATTSLCHYPYGPVGGPSAAASSPSAPSPASHPRRDRRHMLLLPAAQALFQAHGEYPPRHLCRIGCKTRYRSEEHTSELQSLR